MKLQVERLEERNCPYVIWTGIPWEGPITFSTDDMDLKECARALQKWANYCNLDIRWAGEGNEGDITWTYEELDPGVQGQASPPNAGGDIKIDPDATHEESTMLHEAGHALDLFHSNVSGVVMSASTPENWTQLQGDDIDGIRAIYGERVHDEFDLAASNNTNETATELVDMAFSANLRSINGKDWYTAQATSTTLSITVTSESLLAPRARIQRANGSYEQNSADWGGEVTTTITNAVIGQQYWFLVNEKVDSVFATGNYSVEITGAEPLD